MEEFPYNPDGPKLVEGTNDVRNMIQFMRQELKRRNYTLKDLVSETITELETHQTNADDAVEHIVTTLRSNVSSWIEIGYIEVSLSKVVEEIIHLIEEQRISFNDADITDSVIKKLEELINQTEV